MKIDSHLHFWRTDRNDYGWLTPEVGPLFRDFEPDDVVADLDDAGLEQAIAIQAAPTIAETEFLLEHAAQEDFISGVVGWADLESEEAPATISWLAQNPALIGLRPMLHAIPDLDWMLRSELAPAFEAMIAADLTFDALIGPEHLPNTRRLLAAYPDLRVVIDHGAQPDILSGDVDEWAAHMTAIGRESSAFCKVSGLVTGAGENWEPADLKPYIDHLLGAFGEERLLWGSDWPFCLLAASYGDWVEISAELLENSGADIDAVFGENAVRAYRLDGVEREFNL